MGGVFMGVLIALRALRRNVLRATLTIMGLMIGVAAVVMVTGLAAGARDFVGKRFRTLGTNNMVVSPQNNAASGVRGKATAARLTEDDARAMLKEVASVTAVAPVLKGRVLIGYGERNITTTVIGSTSSFFVVRDWPLARGEIWTASEELTKAKVCVIGSTVAEELFPNEDPVGRIIRIARHPYRITGVLTSKGQDLMLGRNQDDVILTPIGSARMRIHHVTGGAVTVVLVAAASTRASGRARADVEGVLRQRHRIGDRPPDFEVYTQKRLLKTQTLIFDALTAFLVCIASISLLVGGIGVMNIMLVSVTERTREIGIRLAIGATRGDVMTQFLVEAAVLALMGGVLGIAAGMAGLAGFESVIGWRMTVSPVALAAGVTVSTLTGILFGFAPARQASRLDPIDALRHE